MIQWRQAVHLPMEPPRGRRNRRGVCPGAEVLESRRLLSAASRPIPPLPLVLSVAPTVDSPLAVLSGKTASRRTVQLDVGDDGSVEQSLKSDKRGSFQFTFAVNFGATPVRIVAQAGRRSAEGRIVVTRVAPKAQPSPASTTTTPPPKAATGATTPKASTGATTPKPASSQPPTGPTAGTGLKWPEPDPATGPPSTGQGSTTVSPPPTPTLQLDPADDSRVRNGDSSGATLTNSPTVHFRGTATPGGDVIVSIVGPSFSFAKRVTADAAGNFSLPAQTLPEIPFDQHYFANARAVVGDGTVGSDFTPNVYFTVLKLPKNTDFGSSGGGLSLVDPPSLRDYLDAGNTYANSAGPQTSPSGNRTISAWINIAKTRLSDGTHYSASFQIIGQNRSMWSSYVATAAVNFYMPIGLDGVGPLQLIYSQSVTVLVGEGEFSVFGTVPTSAAKTEYLDIPESVAASCTYITIQQSIL